MIAGSVAKYACRQQLGGNHDVVEDAERKRNRQIRARQVHPLAGIEDRLQVPEAVGKARSRRSKESCHRLRSKNVTSPIGIDRETENCRKFTGLSVAQESRHRSRRCEDRSQLARAALAPQAILVTRSAEPEFE
ncbi:hypothetical protein [Burkholderia seminalis]|uniref:hypothetical protein n=1 Tax=Burkholderia seminalis TaxID=488731 RepID=UPI00158B24AB|nr:hypothetical protein [Burkholderia seminalis]